MASCPTLHADNNIHRHGPVLVAPVPVRVEPVLDNAWRPGGLQLFFRVRVIVDVSGNEVEREEEEEEGEEEEEEEDEEEEEEETR